MEINYVKGPEQYGPIPQREVEAKYVKEKTLDELKGYAEWEALPILPPYEKAKDIINLEDLGEVPEWNTPDSKKLDLLTRLDNIRFALPSRQFIEMYVRRLLLTSYRDRRPFISDRITKIYTDGSEAMQRMAYDTPFGGLVSNGLVITGLSGSGKSTAINEILEKYPQVIVHIENGMPRKTILYVKLDCLANKNIRTVLDSFGSQLDEILRTDPVKKPYESQIKREKTIAGKAEVVVRLINTFAIGLLVLDEVQMLDFDAEKESSYDSLMTIVNKSKVGLISIGTDEATQKLYSYWHTSRRAGIHVPSDEYCQDDQFVSAIIAKLFRYHFFDREVKLTADIIKAYKECSGGTVEKLISIHKEVVTDYIMNGKKATVDGNYVREIAYRKWKDLEGIIEKKRLKEDEIRTRYRKDQDQMRRKLQELERDTTKIVASLKDDNRWDDILVKVRLYLEMTDEYYCEDKIERSITEVMKLKNFDNIDNTEAARKVLSHLRNKGSDRRPGRKPDEGIKEEFDKYGITFKS